MSIIPSTFNTWDFSVRKSVPFSTTYVFIHLSLYQCNSWILILFCGLQAITIILYFLVQIVPDLDIGSSFRSASVSFWCVLIIFWVFPCYLPSQGVPGSSCTFAEPALEWAVSLRSPGLFHWEWFVGTKIDPLAQGTAQLKCKSLRRTHEAVITHQCCAAWINALGLELRAGFD